MVREGGRSALAIMIASQARMDTLLTGKPAAEPPSHGMGQGVEAMQSVEGAGLGLCSRSTDDEPNVEDGDSAVSLPPLATFTRGGDGGAAWASEEAGPDSGKRPPERKTLLSSSTEDEGLSLGGLVPAEAEPPASRLAVAVIALACFCTFGMGGVVFGISSLCAAALEHATADAHSSATEEPERAGRVRRYPVLYSQGYWRSLCTAGEAAACAGATTKCCEPQVHAAPHRAWRHQQPPLPVPSPPLPPLSAQLVRYSLVASVAFFCVDVASAPWGVLARALPPRRPPPTARVPSAPARHRAATRLRMVGGRPGAAVRGRGARRGRCKRSAERQRANASPRIRSSRRLRLRLRPPPAPPAPRPSASFIPMLYAE